MRFQAQLTLLYRRMALRRPMTGRMLMRRAVARPTLALVEQREALGPLGPLPTPQPPR